LGSGIGDSKQEWQHGEERREAEKEGERRQGARCGGFGERTRGQRSGLASRNAKPSAAGRFFI